MRIGALCGSLRRDSWNRRLLMEAAAHVPSEVEWTEIDGVGSLEPYDEDASPASAQVAAFRQALAAVDALVIATPEYNGSIPGPLKNALDWASRPFPDNCLRGKPVLVIGASTGLFGAMWAQADVRRVVGIIGAVALDTELPVGSAHEALADGLPDDLRDQLRTQIGELVTMAGNHDSGGQQ